MAETITVLLVNDQEAVCRMWERFINRTEGLQCVGCAFDGETAIEMALNHQPHVVFMDVMMPGIDGFEATRQIMAALPQTAVIIFSAGINIVEQGFAAGAIDYLIMPVTPEDLVEAIVRAYQKRHGVS